MQRIAAVFGGMCLLLALALPALAGENGEAVDVNINGGDSGLVLSGGSFGVSESGSVGASDNERSVDLNNGVAILMDTGGTQ